MEEISEKMKPSKVYIVSVGTSLVSKFNEEQEKRNNRVQKKLINLRNCDLTNITESFSEFNGWGNKNWQTYPDGFETDNQSKEWLTFSCFRKKLNDFLGMADPQINSNSIKKSAELHSLFGNNDRCPNPNDQIILLPTLTAEGILCALVLKDFLTSCHDSKYSKTEIRVIKGLGKADDSKFKDKGLPNLLNCLMEWVGESQKNKEVVLVPTGGYKAIIPYFVLVAILHKVPLLYVYEDSDFVLELPRIPLGLDVEKWMREKVYIDGIIAGGMDLSGIDEDFKSLFEPNNGGYKLSSLGEALENSFRQITGHTPLQMLTGKTHLLEYLNDDLRQKFKKLVEIGPLLWKGDRLPEMVDHSLKHHYDLFLLAERFLLPIFSLKEQFLKDWELFILLSALYLHDCGHVLGRVKHNNTYIRLFPTEIREYHHILGYERLRNFNDPNYLSQEIYKELEWENDSSNYENVWEKYMKAIAAVGLFHRKSMPLKQSGSPVECFFWKEKENGPWNPQNSEEVKREGLSFNEEEISYDRFALLVSLLRIIDSLDNQKARIGNEIEEKFHLAQLECELQEEEERAKYLEEALKASLNDDKIKEIDEAIEKEAGAYKKRELKNNSPTSEPKGKSIRDVISEIPEENVKRLAEEYINAKIRAFFKSQQKPHFEQKSQVEEVLISHQKKNGEILITIDLKIKNNDTQKKKEILNDLKNEYTQEVEETLKRNGIQIQYNQVDPQGGG